MKISIVIPARNELFVTKTIEDILENIEGETEILVGLDGAWAEIPIKDDPRVTILHTGLPVGQRAITNKLVRLSNAKWVMKVDAHCSFDKGFDVKMMNLMQDDFTMIPVMRNLHAFDWVCPDGHRRYQSPSGVCTECGKETTRDIKWVGKKNPQSTAYRFDRTMHFQYWNDWGKAQTGELTESMSIQGSCFMVTREKYWELDLCSEEFNSWGQQGVEVACKTWLSGGKVMINHNTWYAHMFRTQGGDFSFPYDNPESKVQENRDYSKKLFAGDNWDKAIYPFQWLLDKFNPPDWGLTKGVLYYTDNQLNMKLARTCRKYIKESGLPITSVSLKPMDFGKNIHLHLKRGKFTMFKQILAGLEAMTEDIIFFCEHDVIYHPSHFDFVPTKDKFYYNQNNWRVRDDGFAVNFDHDSTSQMCAYRELLIEEYRKIVAKGDLYKGSYEPGTRNKRSARWSSKEPNIDIRHTNNLTENRWSTDKFRNKATCQNWIEGSVSDLWIKEI